MLDGATIPLADVAADVTLHHGRSDVSDDPTASTCQITIYDVDKAFVKGIDVGSSLVLNVQDPPAAAVSRFQGTVTDATLDDDDLTLIAAARLATLDRYPIGLADWPEETWTARVTRVFSEAGLSSYLVLQADPLFNPVLVGRTAATAGPTTVADYLAFLAPMVGAAVADRTDGKILVQALGARTLAGAYQLDPADVAYSPPWLQVLPGANVVTVRYTGDQSQSVTARDDASVAIYRERPQTIDTTFKDAGDATTRASLRLSRGAFPHWNIRDTPVLRGLMLNIGQPVELSGMPPASPFDPWSPILEGWTDAIAGGDWTMTLALSDPLQSGLLLPWNVLPVDWAWNEINPVTAWKDALTLDSLAPLMEVR